MNTSPIIIKGTLTNFDETFQELIKKFPISNPKWKLNVDLNDAYTNVSLSDHIRFKSARKLSRNEIMPYCHVWTFFVKDDLIPCVIETDPWNRKFPEVDGVYQRTAVKEPIGNKAPFCRIYTTSVDGWKIHCVDYAQSKFIF